MSMAFAAQIWFWLSAIALLYTYAVYPLLVVAIGFVRPRMVRRGEFWPTVTIIITAYNEERDLAAKLENTLALDYPRELLEIIVASDCSTDRTDVIAQSFAARGVRLHRQAQRQGKTMAQNAAVAKASGEIIVFSDATSHYESKVLRALMPNFADPSIGCVAGRLVYVEAHSSPVGRGAKSYWSYETFLKRHESRAGSLIGASGCLYAVRRSAYVPLPEEACSDFIIASEMIECGLRTIYEPEAVCTELTNRHQVNELKMRVRVIAQTYADLWRRRHLLNPLRSSLFGWQLFSHKVMRYLAPLFLAGLLIASGILASRSSAYAIVFAAQVAGYAISVFGLVLEGIGIHSRLLALPQYFVLTNVAAIAALCQVLRGNNYSLWEPIRENTQSITHETNIRTSIV